MMQYSLERSYFSTIHIVASWKEIRVLYYSTFGKQHIIIGLYACVHEMFTRFLQHKSVDILLQQ